MHLSNALLHYFDAIINALIILTIRESSFDFKFKNRLEKSISTFELDSTFRFQFLNSNRQESSRVFDSKSSTRLDAISLRKILSKNVSISTILFSFRLFYLLSNQTNNWDYVLIIKNLTLLRNVTFIQFHWSKKY